MPGFYTDQDGLPDLLEDYEALLGYPLNKDIPAYAAGDLDGDGVANLQAYSFGGAGGVG